MNRSKAIRAALLITFVSAVVFLGYGPARTESAYLLICYAIAFISYMLVVHRVQLKWRQLLWLAIGLRVALLFAPITWTDDHFRYLWDGLCSTQGISPFAHVPSQLVGDPSNVFTPEHFEQLNSPEFHSVYPPLAQAMFALATWFGGDLETAIIALRVLVIAFDLLAILALGSLLKGRSDRIFLVSFYALNPLVLMEFSVNLHTEVLMIAPCIYAIHLFLRQRFDASAVALAIGASAKLWPLLFMLWLPSRMGWKGTIRSAAIMSIVFIASWLPFHTPGMMEHLLSGLKLYVSYLEFNAPLFEGLRSAVGDGPVKGTGLLSLITMIGLGFYGWWLFRKRSIPWAEAMLGILAIYLFGAQAIHPWNILPLVAFSVLTRYRWPILWTLLIIPTYITYSSEPYQQPYWWLAVEYTILWGYMFWEMKIRKDGSLSVERAVT